MKAILALPSRISVAATKYRIDPTGAWLIFLAPFLIILMYTLLLGADTTKNLAKMMLRENNAVELLTFGTLLVGGILGLAFVAKMRKANVRVMTRFFYVLFSLALIVIAMEEISWGQWFFGFNTPAFISEKNAQQELTLHNLSIWHDYIEALPLIYAVAGMAGIYLSRWSAFTDISPSVLLMSWFTIIATFSAIDLMHEFVVFSNLFFHYINHLDELIELLVGISGLLYVYLGGRKLILAGLATPAAANAP